jgi:hypothetical protein
MTATKRKNYFQKLFFVQRRPRLRVPFEWQKPVNDDEFQKQIHEEDFVSHKYWSEGSLDDHPVVKRDVEDLEEYLLPAFFKFNQQSRYFQNQYYLYQWVFTFGAFVTTVLGSLATLYYPPPGMTATANDQTIQQVFSFATAIMGAITAFTTILSNRGEPQKQWSRTRRLAEELRMNYFTYISHLPPFDSGDRVRTLRETVLDIRQKEVENV